MVFVKICNFRIFHILIGENRKWFIVMGLRAKKPLSQTATFYCSFSKGHISSPPSSTFTFSKPSFFNINAASYALKE